MSKELDQRIVEMSFENHKFEKGIKESEGSLKSFSNMLRNMDGTRGLDGLNQSVGMVSKSFSWLDQIAIGALRQIGAQAVITGKNLVKSMSVDQLTAGMAKYEEKIAAVQTMVSAGYKLDEVEKTMAQLMWFSDETSYSFSDMAQNMGKFVSAGVELKTASKAMQGIATWAAHSGKNSQAASIAMFNLSQAISMGYVDTLNWRSIMNQNMNTVMFKKIAIGVAEATGAIKKGQITIQNFDTDLKTKWFTNDVLIKTLEQYSNYAEEVKKVQDSMGFDTANEAMRYMEENADKFKGILNTVGKAAFKAAQESKSFSDSIAATKDAVSTGWMKTYEIIFGTLDEAKANFTSLTEILWEVFASRGGRRNDLLAELKKLGGISDIFRSIKNTGAAVTKVLHSVSQGVDQIFPPKTAEQWKKITSFLRIFTDKLILSDPAADKLRRTAAGLFAVLDIGLEIFRTIIRSIFESSGGIRNLGGTILDTTAKVGDFLVAVNKAVKGSGVFRYTILAIRVAIALLGKFLYEGTGRLREFMTRLWNMDRPFVYLKKSITDTIYTIMKSMRDFFRYLSGADNIAKKSRWHEALEPLVGETATKGILTALHIFQKFIGFLGTNAVSAIGSFGDSITNLNVNKIATFVTAGVFLIFVQQLTELTKAMTNFTTQSSSFIANLNKRLLGTATRGSAQVKDFAYAISILAASLYVLSKIPAKELGKSLAALGTGLLIFVTAYGALQAIGLKVTKALDGKEMVESVFKIAGMAGALATMAVALRTISKIPMERVWGSVAVLSAMLGLISAYQLVYAALAMIPHKHLVKVHFIEMSAGVLALTGTILILTQLNIEHVKMGIKKLSMVLAFIGAFELVYSGLSRVVHGGSFKTSILKLSASLLLIVGLLKLISVIDAGQALRQVGTLGKIVGILAGIELVFGLVGRITKSTKAKSHLLQIAGGMTALIALMVLVGNLDEGHISRGLKSLGGVALILGSLQLVTTLATVLIKDAQVQKIFGRLTLAMGALSGLAYVLGDDSIQQNLNRGMVNLLKLTLMMASVQVLLKAATRLGGGALSLATIGAVTAAIYTIVGAIAILGIQDTNALEKATNALGVAAVAVAGMAFGLSSVVNALSLLPTGKKRVATILKTLGPILASLTVLLTSTGAFLLAVKFAEPMLKSISWNEMGKFVAMTTFVGTLIVAFSRIPFGVAARFPGLVDALKISASVVLATLPFFGAIALFGHSLSKISWDTMGKFAASIAAMVPIIAATSLLSAPLMALNAIPFAALGTGALKAFAIIGGIVLGMAGLAYVMSRLSGVSTELQNGIDVAHTLLLGFGKLMAAPVAGFSAEVFAGIGMGISAFANALGQFDPGAAAGIKSIAEAVLYITHASVLDGIARIATLGLIGDPIQNFARQMSGVMSAFANLDGAIISKASINLDKLGQTIVKYLGPLVTAANDIPNIGGLISIFTGDNSLGDFGRQASNFMIAMSMPGVTEQQVVRASKNLERLGMMAPHLTKVADAASRIPNSGWMAKFFAGDNTIDDFGRRLKKFVSWLGSVTVIETDATVETLKRLAPMAQSLKSVSDAAKDIPNSGGFIGWFAGNNDLDMFAEQVYKFTKKLGRVAPEKATNASSVIQKLEPMVESLVRLAHGAKAIPGVGVFGTNNLEILAKQIEAFAKYMSRVDVSSIAPATEAIHQMQALFRNFANDTIGVASDDLTKKRYSMATSLQDVLETAGRAVERYGKPIPGKFKEIFETSLRELGPYVARFRSVGQDIVNGLKDGIEGRQSVAVEAIKRAGIDIINKFRGTVDVHSPSRIFKEIGGWLPKSVGIGISKGTKYATSAAVKMGEETEEAARNQLDVHSFSKKWGEIGEWTTKSLGMGAKKGGDYLKKVAKDLSVDYEKILAPVGQNFIGNSSGVTDTLASLTDLLAGDSTVEKAKTAGEKVGNSFGSGMASGITGGGKGGKGGSGGGIAKAVKSAIDALQEALEEKRFYGRLTLQEELDAYEKLRGKYKKGSEERKKLDREVYRLTKEIYEAQKEYIDTITAAEEEAARRRKELTSKYAEDVKKIEEDSAKRLADLRARRSQDEASAREQAYQRIEDREKRHHEDIARIIAEADSERARTRQEYADRQKEIHSKLLADIEAQNRAYEDAVRSRADSIHGVYGLFSKVEQEDPEKKITGKDLLENLRDQGAALSEWKQSLEELGKRGVGDELIKELEKLGPASRLQIKALLQLTDAELNEYVGLFKGKYTFARQKAEEELKGLKESTSKTIAELKSQSVKDLAGLDTAFGEAMKNINSKMAADLANLKSIFDQEITQINDELSKRLNEIEASFTQSQTDINNDTKARLAELKKTYDENMTQIDKDVDAKLKEVKSKYSTTMRDVRGLTEKEMKGLIAQNKEKLELLNTDSAALLKKTEKTFETSGKTVSKLFDAGLKALGINTSNAVTTMNTKLGASFSQSAVTAGNAGYNVSRGFAQGITDGSFLAVNAAVTMADKAVNAAKSKLKINSPSKVFIGIGKSVNEGFSKGIVDNAQMSVVATTGMVDEVVTSLDNTLRQIGSDLERDWTLSPKITPVVDLSGTRGLDMSGLFPSTSLSRRVPLSTSGAALQNGSTSDNSVVTNFNIGEVNVRSESDIDAIATALHQKQQAALRGRGIRR